MKNLPYDSPFFIYPPNHQKSFPEGGGSNTEKYTPFCPLSVQEDKPAFLTQLLDNPLDCCFPLVAV